MIDSLLAVVKPDFIQVDSKGHPGVTSFPTKVANGTHVASFCQISSQSHPEARRGLICATPARLIN